MAFPLINVYNNIAGPDSEGIARALLHYRVLF